MSDRTSMKGAALQAARLYFVDGIRPQTKCAEMAGVSKAAASKAKLRIQKEMEKEGQLVTLEITVPADKKETLLMFVKTLTAS